MPWISTKKKPCVAILTYRDQSRIFRGNRDNFIDLLHTAKAEGVNAYIVAQDEFNPHGRGNVKGFIYSSKQKKWIRVERPFPHVVYNRIPYRKFEQLPEVQKLLQEMLHHPEIRLFNPAFFSKWSLFEWLYASRSTRKHIPETVKLNGPVDLVRLTRKYKVIYLKPIKGKAGKGIMKVQRVAGTGPNVANGYRLIHQQSTGTESAVYDSLWKLYEVVKSHTGDKEYIAQQGITLAKAGGRPFDLRILVQKNAKGIWRISGVGARVAGASSITTHVPRGGSIDDPVKLLTTVFGAARCRDILREARTTALLLAQQIEQGSGHTLGEMSMDLGVDHEGKLWFFEANSKPMKFDEPHIRSRSLRRLVRYWKYLTGIPRRKGRRVQA